MKKNLKRMGVVTALAIVAWGAVPAWADDNPAQFWDFASSWDEGLILGENFESLNVGDPFSDGPLSPACTNCDGADPTESVFLVNNDNDDLNGNHFDGDSAGDGLFHVFTFDDSPADHGAPTTGTYYIEGTVDNIDHNSGVTIRSFDLPASMSHTYSGHVPSRGNDGWGYTFGPEGQVFSGPDVFDDHPPTNPHRIIHQVTVETGFLTTYSFLAVDLKTGASWGHGGENGIPNHIPGFGTPTLRLFYDTRGRLTGSYDQNTDFDDFRIATVPWIPPLIPEPATFALLGLGSLLMLRRRV